MVRGGAGRWGMDADLDGEVSTFLADVVESTAGNIGGIHANGLLQEHRSPELRFFLYATGDPGLFPTSRNA